MNQIAKVLASVQAVLLASFGLIKPGVSATSDHATAAGDETTVSAQAEASPFLLLAAGSVAQIEDAFDQVVAAEVETARARADAAAQEVLVAKLDLDNVSPAELSGAPAGASGHSSAAAVGASENSNDAQFEQDISPAAGFGSNATANAESADY
jgi:hypothetical protein